jgi:hypothetical protein
VGGIFLWRSKSTFSWFAHRFIGWEFLSFNSQKWRRLKNENSSSDPGPRVLGTGMKPNHMNQGSEITLRTKKVPIILGINIQLYFL